MGDAAVPSVGNAFKAVLKRAACQVCQGTACSGHGCRDYSYQVRCSVHGLAMHDMCC